MTVEYIRYDIPKERHAEFIAAYEEGGKSLSASPHCLRYEVTEGVEEPDKFTVRIEWDSVDGHMKGFRQSPEFKTFFASVQPFFSAITEMKHYRLVGHGQGGAGK